MPKNWTTSKCYRCKWFVAYPVHNGTLEDWVWECDSEAEESQQEQPLKLSSRCSSFYPNLQL
jgi:hypothetical protein